MTNMVNMVNMINMGYGIWDMGYGIWDMVIMMNKAISVRIRPKVTKMGSCIKS